MIGDRQNSVVSIFLETRPQNVFLFNLKLAFLAPVETLDCITDENPVRRQTQADSSCRKAISLFCKESWAQHSQPFLERLIINFCYTYTLRWGISWILVWYEDVSSRKISIVKVKGGVWSHEFILMVQCNTEVIHVRQLSNQYSDGLV